MKVLNYIDFNKAETLMDIIYMYFDCLASSNYNISYNTIEIIRKEYTSFRDCIVEIINTCNLNEELFSTLEANLIHMDLYYKEIISLINEDVSDKNKYDDLVIEIIIVLSNTYRLLYEYGLSESFEIERDG